MELSRKDVACYAALISASCTIIGGIVADMGAQFSAISLWAVAFVSLFVMLACVSED